MAGKNLFEGALAMQAANVTQRATLDMLTTKVVKVLVLLRQEREARAIGEEQEQPAPDVDLHNAQATLDAIADTLSLTRGQCANIRAQHVYEFPDERIQAAITRAVDEITNALLGRE